jgi:hypothetical protein
MLIAASGIPSRVVSDGRKSSKPRTHVVFQKANTTRNLSIGANVRRRIGQGYVKASMVRHPSEVDRLRQAANDFTFEAAGP